MIEELRCSYSDGSKFLRSVPEGEYMWSYDRHKQQELELSEKLDLPACYRSPDSVDAWRHRRMLEFVRPLASDQPDSTWLTVGDGRFGSDAYYLASQGLDVTASSISSHTLEAAYAKGFISKYSAENVERLSLKDDSVDFVLCKETYHHFPRPALGFYEMLRVARKGIVLIEPMEESAKLLDKVKATVKRLLRRRHAYDQFEPAGNFIFRINIKELSKMMTALNLSCLAWKGFNDFWYSPFSEARAKSLSVGWLGTISGITAQNALSRVGMLNYGLATLICFKVSPDTQLKQRLKREGFRVLELPINPYL